MKKIFSFFLLLLGIMLIVAPEEEKEFNLNFQQHDYHLTFERFEVIRYNKEYVRDMSAVTFKHNRTQAVANWTFTFNTDIGYDLVFTAQAYKFASNEYRLFPLRFNVNFCKVLTADFAGARTRLMSCGNFTGCPLLKGKKQHICNFFPDESKIPPYIPNGNYKVEAQALYFSKEVFLLSVHTCITRPLQWHK